MYSIDVSKYANNDSKNRGDCYEWAICRYFGIERQKHDGTAYYEHSDVELPDGRNISVKSRDWTLMGGTLCRGCNTFEGIWRRYYKNTHSNLWIYVTHDWVAYVMNKKEFSKFVHKFCTLAHESSSKGGGLKIRCHKESRYIRAWLVANCG